MRESKNFSVTTLISLTIFFIILASAMPLMPTLFAQQEFENGPNTEEDSLDWYFDPEIEDSTCNYIQSTPAEYKWLFPSDKNSVELWKQESRSFILPIDISMCYLPVRGMFRSHRVRTTIPHTGIDLYASDSTDVLAAMTGRVIYVGDIGAKGKSKAFGWTIIVEHTNNWESYNYYTIYAHLNKKSIRIKNGDDVLQGQVIAKVGNTGNAANYPTQVHFEVRRTKNPLFAQIRVSSPHCKKQVQLLDPEVIYKRELFYAQIRNVDTEGNLDQIKKNLPDNFDNDNNILEYIEQVRGRLRTTIFSPEDIQLAIAANVSSEGTVSREIGNHFAAKFLSKQSRSFTFFTPAQNAETKNGAHTSLDLLTQLKKSKFKKHLKVEFTFNSHEGVRLFYAKSDGQINCLFYDNGTIIEKGVIEKNKSSIISYKDIAKLEFGYTKNFFDLDSARFSCMVIQTQNLISHWSNGKEVVFFTAAIPENRISYAESDFVVPSAFIKRLQPILAADANNSDQELVTLAHTNRQNIQHHLDAYDAAGARRVDEIDRRLVGTSFTFEQLDTITAQIDGLIAGKILDSAAAQPRIAKINKFGLHQVYAFNDKIWDLLETKGFDAAMDLFTRYSAHFLRYSEEQYAQVFKRLEEREKPQSSSVEQLPQSSIKATRFDSTLTGVGLSEVSQLKQSLSRNHARDSLNLTSKEAMNQ